jgi:hypothetical protein
MRDIDERLTEGLRELVDRAPVEAEVWDDTARYVRKHKQRRQAALAGGVAAIVAAIGITAAVRSDGGKHDGKGPLRIEQPGKDLLPEGSTLLAMRDGEVHAVASDGHDLGSVYRPKRAPAAMQISNDHKTLWYLAQDNCKEQNDQPVVRVDLEHGTEQVVTGGAAFAISPDGTRMALARRDGCIATDGQVGENLFIRDLATGSETKLALANDERLGMYGAGQIAWSGDGTQVAFQLNDEDTSSHAVVFGVPSEGTIAQLTDGIVAVGAIGS